MSSEAPLRLHPPRRRASAGNEAPAIRTLPQSACICATNSWAFMFVHTDVTLPRHPVSVQRANHFRQKIDGDDSALAVLSRQAKQRLPVPNSIAKEAHREARKHHLIAGKRVTRWYHQNPLRPRRQRVYRVASRYRYRNRNRSRCKALTLTDTRASAARRSSPCRASAVCRSSPCRTVPRAGLS